ncbi:MAG: cob(I)yrinic acid a,c-diamide adenosyltransferase [Rhodospirillaceae bacterium]
MVKLDKIYTKGGDGGETSLGDGSRVSKYAPRIHAQGDIDELNAAIGLARLHAAPVEADETLARIQNDLFDLGADVTRPGDDPDDGSLRIRPVQVAWLETEIDTANEGLAPLRSFVLRGGSEFAAALHFACTVCRRAERSMCALAAGEPVNAEAMRYVNRLSDLLFVMARAANDGGASDVLWRPGGNAA